MMPEAGQSGTPSGRCLVRVMSGDASGDVEVRWQQVALPVHGRKIGARVYRPDDTTGDWLVWAHGGSWSAGSVADWHPAGADLAASRPPIRIRRTA